MPCGSNKGAKVRVQQHKHAWHRKPRPVETVAWAQTVDQLGLLDFQLCRIWDTPMKCCRIRTVKMRWWPSWHVVSRVSIFARCVWPWRSAELLTIVLGTRNSFWLSKMASCKIPMFAFLLKGPPEALSAHSPPTPHSLLLRCVQNLESELSSSRPRTSCGRPFQPLRVPRRRLCCQSGFLKRKQLGSVCLVIKRWPWWNCFICNIEGSQRWSWKLQVEQFPEAESCLVSVSGSRGALVSHLVGVCSTGLQTWVTVSGPLWLYTKRVGNMLLSCENSIEGVVACKTKKLKKDADVLKSRDSRCAARCFWRFVRIRSRTNSGLQFQQPCSVLFQTCCLLKFSGPLIMPEYNRQKQALWEQWTSPVDALRFKWVWL